MRRGLALAPVLVLGLAPACRSLPIGDAKSDPAAPPGAAPVAEVEMPLAWGTRPPKEGVLFPVVDGMCIHGRVFVLENGPIFTYGTYKGPYSRGGTTTAVAFQERGLAVETGIGFGRSFTNVAITAIRGRYPERMWAVRDQSSRMGNSADIVVGAATDEHWRALIEVGGKSNDVGLAASDDTPLHDFGEPIALPDGAYLVPEALMSVKQGTVVTTYDFRVIDAKGSLVPSAKVPGRDLAELPFDERYVGGVGGFELTTGEDDTLWATTKTTLVTDRGGVVTEEPLPAPGTPHGRLGTTELWLATKGDPPLYHRTASGWQAAPLPPPPFGNASHGPLAIEELTIASDGDVFVNARRVEKGLGWKTTEPYRIVYRTKRPSEVVRCQDVRNEDTGHGLWSWPPSADDACATPFVTLLRQDVKTPPKSYPAIAGKLRGKTEYGATLAFVDFEGRGSLNVGIPMTDFALARKLATLVSQSLDYRADVVCGRPTPIRELTLDVAKGTFSDATPSK